MDDERTAGEPVILLEGVAKRFTLPKGGEQTALDGVDLAVRPGEILCLIGASGSGKTTLLRSINRLVEPSRGRVSVEGRDVAALDVVELRRGMGYVVQSGGLFPHLTVERNIGLLCRLEGWARERTRERVERLLERVRLPPRDFAQRYPRELSGGQRQRVGVARALALDPPIVLLDEPFGALDPITRRELQQEFLELGRERVRTMVFVTHDLSEAFLLADRVALMDAGRVLQCGSPRELMEEPANEHVAAFVARHGDAGGRC